MLGAPRPGVDGRSRYFMLETLRTFGQERLEQGGGDRPVRSAVAVWTVSQAEEAAAGFESGATEPTTARWMDAEADNLHGVLEWALRHDIDLALRFAVVLSPWWLLRGRWREGRSLLQKAVAGAGDPSAKLVAAAENWIARFSRRIPDYPNAIEPLRHAFELLSPLGPSAGLVDTLWQQSSIPQISGRLDEAAGIANQALDMARSMGYLTGQAYACVALAVIALDGGDYETALAWAEAANDIDETALTGDAQRWASVLLALAVEASGDTARARAVRTRSLDACRRAGDHNLMNAHLRNLAIMDIKARRFDDASPHLIEAIDDGARARGRVGPAGILRGGCGLGRAPRRGNGGSAPGRDAGAGRWHWVRLRGRLPRTRLRHTTRQTNIGSSRRRTGSSRRTSGRRHAPYRSRRVGPSHACH